MAVEDDSVDRLTLKRALAKSGVIHALFEANDGVEGLALLRSRAVPSDRRIVLLDINMPRMNGLEMMREVRADAALRATALIILTTSTLASDRAEAHRLNCAGYFLKPLRYADFVEVITTIDRYWSRVAFAPAD